MAAAVSAGMASSTHGSAIVFATTNCTWFMLILRAFNYGYRPLISTARRRAVAAAATTAITTAKADRHPRSDTADQTQRLAESYELARSHTHRHTHSRRILLASLEMAFARWRCSSASST